MRSTTEIVEEMPGLTREAVAYLVRLGVVTPVGRGPGKGRPFVFSDTDAALIQLIQTERDAGYTLTVAIRRARNNLRQPSLLPGGVS